LIHIHLQKLFSHLFLTTTIYLDTAKILLSDLSNNLQIFWFLISDNKNLN